MSSLLMAGLGITCTISGGLGALADARARAQEILDARAARDAKSIKNAIEWYENKRWNKFRGRVCDEEKAIEVLTANSGIFGWESIEYDGHMKLLRSVRVLVDAAEHAEGAIIHLCPKTCAALYKTEYTIDD